MCLFLLAGLYSYQYHMKVAALLPIPISASNKLPFIRILNFLKKKTEYTTEAFLKRSFVQVILFSSSVIYNPLI